MNFDCKGAYLGMDYTIDTESDLELTLLQCKAGDSVMVPKNIFLSSKHRFDKEAKELKVDYQQAEWPSLYLAAQSAGIEITFYKTESPK